MTRLRLLTVGLMWIVLTVIFEIGLGRVATLDAPVGRPWPPGDDFPHDQNGHSMPNSVLFQSVTLHNLTLPNRIVLAPMTRSRAGTARLPNKLMAEYGPRRVHRNEIEETFAQGSRFGPT